jgi:hypothetical protein
VLRADDRGVEKSSGDFASATTADFASDTTADFATDTEAGINYLKTRAASIFCMSSTLAAAPSLDRCAKHAGRG